MEKKIFSRNKVKLVFAIAVCVIFISLTFVVQSAKPVKTYYLNIPTAAFISKEALYDNYVNMGFMLYLTSGATTYIICPVFLPQGATMTEFRAYCIDANTNYNLQFTSSLYKNNISGTLNTMIATMSLSTVTTLNYIRSAFDDTIDSLVIDNSINQYWIIVHFSADVSNTPSLAFYGCRIAYTL